MFGIQWDLTCKFLEEKTSLTTTDIKTNSTNWGNYADSSIALSRGKYNIAPSNSSSTWILFTTDTTNYVTDKKTNSDENYCQLLTTGASEDTKKMNIYDFAGNEWEWTLEQNISGSSSPCAVGGGNYYGNGSGIPAAYRYYTSTSNSGYSIGFRPVLY